MMEQNTKHFKGRSIIWIGAFILANFRGTVFWDVLTQAFHVKSMPLIEVGIWVVLLSLAYRSLNQEGLLADYALVWKQNNMLILFMSVAALSIFWSISFSVSLYRCLLLIGSSFIAAHISVSYSLKEILDILFRFGAVLLIICFVLAVFLPIVGVMLWEPYTGSWRGVYWHKNHFGGIAALFNLVFLITLLNEIGKEKSRLILNAAFYLFSAALVYLSKSAAGYILVVITNFSVFLGFVWLKIRHRLKPVHCYSVVAVGVLTLVVVFLNLDFVFGLFGRDATMTGRSGLWSYLLQGVVAHSPWFGYGFGAIWGFNSFRISTQHVLGWTFPVVIADNGFLDILLHVGLIGFIPFLGVLITALIRFIRYAFQKIDLLSFSPLFIFLFVLLANVSFSFFLEAETFIWLVFAILLFSITRQLHSTTS